MSFQRTARAALVGSKCLRRMIMAAVLLLLAAFFAACGTAKLPAFGSEQNAYVTLPTENTVLLLRISALTGVITTGVRTPEVSGTSPNGLALLGSKFLYVANSEPNTISIFKLASDGSLTLTGIPTPEGGTGPNVVIIDPSGKYLLVTNTFSNDVSVFTIDSGSGAITAVAGSPFPANLGPSDIVMPPAGNLVYVSNPGEGTVTAFTFDPTSGNLTRVAGSPFSSGAGASGLAITSDGQFLYAANTTAPNPGSGNVGNLSGFTIDATTGNLTRLAGSPFTSPVGSDPSNLVVDPTGRFLFALTSGGSFSVWCFTIDSLSGELTPTPGSPFSVAAGGLFALIDPKGNFFYIGSGPATGIEAYTYNQNNGQPTVIGNSPFSTGSAPGKMVIVE